MAECLEQSAVGFGIHANQCAKKTLVIGVVQGLFYVPISINV